MAIAGQIGSMLCIGPHHPLFCPQVDGTAVLICLKLLRLIHPTERLCRTAICELWGNLRRAEPMNAEQYRRNARNYLARTRCMANSETRTLMIDFAIMWIRLAEIAERYEPIVQQQQQMQQTKNNEF